MTIKKTKELKIQVNTDITNALFHAVKENNFQKVSLLLNCGADISVSDKNGYGVLSITLLQKKPNKEIVQLLLNNKINPDREISTGMLPLQWAIVFKRVDILELLLKAKANPLLDSSHGTCACDYVRELSWRLEPTRFSCSSQSDYSHNYLYQHDTSENEPFEKAYEILATYTVPNKEANASIPIENRVKTLKELSRKAFRDNILAYNPSILDILEIPESIKEYLRKDCLYDTFIPGLDNSV